MYGELINMLVIINIKFKNEYKLIIIKAWEMYIYIYIFVGVKISNYVVGSVNVFLKFC